VRPKDVRPARSRRPSPITAFGGRVEDFWRGPYFHNRWRRRHPVKGLGITLQQLF
jgi:hypothetical protein